MFSLFVYIQTSIQSIHQALFKYYLQEAYCYHCYNMGRAQFQLSKAILPLSTHASVLECLW